MNRRWAAVVAPAMVVPALVGAGLALLSGAAGAATPSAPQPSPSPLSLVVPLPSPLPNLNLVTTGQPATNPLAGLFPAETETIPQMQAALFADVNAERAAAGLGPVVTNAWAQGIAMGHSQDMANARNIWHNYSGYIDVAKQAIDAYVDGENVGMAETLVQVDAALMASPTHKANILYPLFNTIGIGVAQDVDGYVYVTEDFADIRPTGGRVVNAAMPASAAHPNSALTAPPAPSPAAPVVAPAAAASPIVIPTPPSSAASAPAGHTAMAATAAVRAAGAGSSPTSRLAAVALATLLAVAAVATGARRAARRAPARHRPSRR